MFTDAERLKLQEDVHDYNSKFLKWACQRIYKELVVAHKARPVNYVLLTSLFKEAKESYEAEVPKKLSGLAETVASGDCKHVGC